MSKEYTGQVIIRSWFNDLTENAPFTLKKGKFTEELPFIISPMVVHFQLKFLIHLNNKQVMFEFGHGSMIWTTLGQNVIFQFLHFKFC
jgi:hypothetical protein